MQHADCGQFINMETSCGILWPVSNIKMVFLLPLTNQSLTVYCQVYCNRCFRPGHCPVRLDSVQRRIQKIRNGGGRLRQNQVLAVCTERSTGKSRARRERPPPPKSAPESIAMGVLDLETLQFMAVSVLVLETVRSVEAESMPLSSRVCGGRIYATILPCLWRQNLCHYPPVSVEAESMPLSSRVCGGRIYATILPCLWRQNLCHYPPVSVEAESMPLSSRVCGGRIYATILPCLWRQNLCHYPPVSVEAESMPLSSRVCGGRIYATILPCLWRQNLCHYPPVSVEAESMPLSSRVLDSLRVWRTPETIVYNQTSLTRASLIRMPHNPNTIPGNLFYHFLFTMM